MLKNDFWHYLLYDAVNPNQIKELARITNYQLLQLF